MPYDNLPKSDWGKMDDCVTKVMAQGKDKQAAIAICYTSIRKERGVDEVSRQDRAKAKRNRAAREVATIKDLSELATAVELKEGDWKDMVTIPESPYPLMTTKADFPWDECMAEQMKRYGDKATAEKVCGKIRAGKSLDEAEAELGVKALDEKSKPTEAVNILTGKIHEGFTVAADQMVQRGYINQEQRIALSGLIGEALDTFNAGLDPAVAQTVIDAECADAIANKEHAPLALFKQADGRLRVVGWASNNRRDKDTPPEIITEAAHKEFMGWLDAHPEHAPEFWHWHTPGTKYAKADWWDYADGFTVYSGLVDVGKEAQAEKAASDGIGMSHGFHVLGYDNAHHHITQYRTFEVSDLPKSRAANPYTSFNVIRKEAGMPFSEAKKAYLLERLKPETVAELERKTSDLKAAADAAGIEAKDLDETVAETVVTAAAEAEVKAQDKPTDNPAAVAADGGDTKPKPDSNADEMDKRMRAMIREELAGMGKEVKAAVLTVAESVKAINERVTTVEETAAKAQQTAKEAVTVTHKSLDEIVAEMISPAPLRKGYRASTAPDTKVAAKKDGAETPAAKAVEEPTLTGKPDENWFVKEVLKPAGLA
jgi:hypothetical protein